MDKRFRILEIFNCIFLYKYRNLTMTSNIMRRRTAGIIIIGDEILKGLITDTNTQFICNGLYNLGVTVVRASIIPDDVNVIANEVREFSKKYTYVITSGGIGPTHDDVTYEGIAKAFNVPLFIHPELMDICKTYYKTPDKIEASKKLATVPKSARLTYGIDKKTGMKSKFPNVAVKNVYIFPGIPELLRYLFNLVLETLFGGSNIQFHRKELFLKVPEVNITTTLNKIVERMPNVNFGSYPEFNHSYYKVKLTMDSVNQEDVNTAFNLLMREFNNEIVQYDPNPLENSQIKIDKYIQNHPKHQQVFLKVKEIFDSSKNVMLWFDGQIQSTLLLHLCYVARSDIKSTFDAIYYEDKNIAKKLQNYILESVKRYNLNLQTILNMNSEYLKQKCDSKTTLIISLESSPLFKNLNQADIGCKIRDPLEGIELEEIWQFVRNLSLPYCQLYDQGDQKMNYYLKKFAGTNDKL